jgi:GAF domain/Sel1 repeat
MSSFPLPDNPNITNAAEKRGQTEHSTVRFLSITRSQAEEPAGPEPGLQAILDQARQRTAAAGAAIVLGTQEAACCRASTGAPAPEVGARLHAGSSLTGLCLATGEILVCDDTNTDERVDPQLCKIRGIRSLLVLPIKQNARVVGVLEVMSIRPNSFNQDDAAAMSKLADQVLPLLSESATISDRHDQLQNGDFDGTDVPKESDNRLSTTNAAEMVESNGPYIGSELPHQTMITRSQEHRSQAYWLRIGLAAALALGIIGYGFHLSRSRAANHGAVPLVSAENHKLAIQQEEVLSVQDLSAPQQDLLSEQDDEQSKVLDNVVTATRRETILAIQEPIHGTDVNRTLNRANAGDPIAQYEMGLQYADGESLPQNYQDAMAWFAKAAENGNDKAQWKLGLGYMKGIGVPQDERKAVVWFKRAANQGDVRAQSALSDAYLSGRGIPKDYVRAYTWSAISVGLRENDNDRLRLIGSRMTAGEIADAHRRISIWWERHSSKADIPGSSQRTAMPHVSDK